MSDEIRVRLLLRAINRFGHEGPAELGKVEALLQAMDEAARGKTGPKGGSRFKQTLAGAVVSVTRGQGLSRPGSATPSLVSRISLKKSGQLLSHRTKRRAGRRKYLNHC